MTKDYEIYVEDMLESIELIFNYTHDKSEVQFSKDSELQDAVVRRLGIIGEAASRLSKEIRDKATGIPWKSVIGLRNIIIHEYSNVSLGKVWDVIQNDLPPLKSNLQQLILLLKEEKI